MPLQTNEHENCHRKESHYLDEGYNVNAVCRWFAHPNRLFALSQCMAIGVTKSLCEQNRTPVFVHRNRRSA